MSSGTKADQDQLRPTPSGTDRVAERAFPGRPGPAQTEWRSPLSQAGRVGFPTDQDQGRPSDEDQHRPSDQDPPCADQDLPDQDQLRPSGAEPYFPGRPGLAQTEWQSLLSWASPGLPSPESAHITFIEFFFAKTS